MRIKFIFPFLLLGLVLGIQFPARSAMAAEVASCPGDYYGFIIGARTEHTRHEYFRDVLTRSYCQVYDLMAINDQLEEIRNNFRTAAFSCEDTSEYKKLYIKLLIEQYFIRNAQSLPPGVLEDFEADELEAQTEKTLEDLKKDMREIFVLEEEQLTESDLEKYFNEWTSKYSDRLPNYAHCEEGAWYELKDTVEDFQETWASISEDFDVEKTKRTKPFFSLKSASGEIETEDWGTVSKSLKSFADKFKKQEEDDVEDPLSPEQAAQQGASIQETFELLESSSESFNAELASAERMGRYQLLYGEGGARPARDLQRLLGQINGIVESSNAVDLPNIEKGVERVYGRQCQ